MAVDVLSRIADSSRRRVERLKTETPVSVLRSFPLYARAPRDLRTALSGPGPSVIAEIKFASPSEGALHQEPGPRAAIEIAASYLSAGARALSILTEPEFFAGSVDYLRAVRGVFPEAALLMKDFFIDPYQFELARAHGADVVLLIAALLGEDLKRLLPEAKGLGLSVLVETHTEEEFALAKEAGADIIGVNSRDLKTLKTDLEVAKRLGRKPAGGSLLVAESGIKTRADIDALWASGYRAFLVGTHLMRQGDPGQGLRALLAK